MKINTFSFSYWVDFEGRSYFSENFNNLSARSCSGYFLFFWRDVIYTLFINWGFYSVFEIGAGVVKTLRPGLS